MNQLALLAAFFQAEASRVKAYEASRAAENDANKARNLLRALFDDRFPQPLPNRRHDIRVVIGNEIVHLWCNREQLGGRGCPQTWGFIHVDKERLDAVASEGELRAAGN